MKSKFSVVIPAYNCEKVIKDALDSVLSQTELNLIGEVIVVNDGSKDNTKYVVEKYIEKHSDKLFIKLINKPNGGVSTARNVGVRSLPMSG